MAKQYENDKIFQLAGTKQFIDEFHHIHGFRIPTVNYEADVNMDALSLEEPK